MNLEKKYFLGNILKEHTRKFIISTALCIPIGLFSPFLAFAQLYDTAGGGKGGDAGRYEDEPLPSDQLGQDGAIGDGGAGGGPNGGVGGQYGERIYESGPLEIDVNGHDGTSGQTNVIGNRASGGGGGGGGVGVWVYDDDERLNVKLYTTIKGGKGGDGGSTSPNQGAGGNGGDGGAGVYLFNTHTENDGLIFGGDGGHGGDSIGDSAFAGRGGNGGAGVIMGSGSNLINTNDIRGGQAGRHGNASSLSLNTPVNKGGNGVELLGNNYLENTTEGKIYGGTSLSQTQTLGGYAISVSGENNIISNNGTIQSAYEGPNEIAIFINDSKNKLIILEKSSIVGNVVSLGRGNTLELSGANEGEFDVSRVGVGEKYRGFDYFAKTGEGVWELKGETNSLTPWIISEGVLSIDSDWSLGSLDGTLTIDGGTLELRSWGEDNDEPDSPLAINRSIILTENNGIIDTDRSDGIIYSVIDGIGGLQKSGEGKLTLTAENSYSGNTYVEEGELEIGNGGTSGSIKGEIEIDESAKLIFNHSGQINLSNNFNGAGKIIFRGTAQTSLVTQSDEFVGTTTIENGFLAFAGTLGGKIVVKNSAAFTGAGFIEYLENSGSVLIGAPEQYGKLLAFGGYSGVEGSNLTFKVALGDDNSEKDYLLINNQAVGKSDVKIVNMGGTGGDTVKGIEIISIIGDSNATFELVGDYNLPSGTPAVIGGAHAYVLEKGTPTEPTDGNWYLRSNAVQEVCPAPEPGQPPQPCQPCASPSNPVGQPCQPCPSPNSPGEQPDTCPITTDIYQPGVPLYSSYAHIVASLNTLSTMRQRVGNRYWNGLAAQTISQGDGPGVKTEEAPDPSRKEMLTDAGLIWARVEAAHNRVELQNSTTSNQYRSDQWNMRGGIDNQIYENIYGRMIAGVWLEYESATADISSYFGYGSVKVNSYGIGGSTTWLSDNGFYIDGQGRYSWTKSDITSATLNRSLIADTKGNSLAVSLESGKQIAINERWSWTPQTQLTWAQTTLDDFTDPYNAAVSIETLRSLTARIGFSIEYGDSWQDKNGYTNRINTQGIANIYRELLGRSPEMSISSERIYIGNEDRTWGELGLAGTYAFYDDKYVLFGEAAVASPFTDIGDNYSLRGNVGFRVNW